MALTVNGARAALGAERGRVSAGALLSRARLAPGREGEAGSGNDTGRRGGTEGRGGNRIFEMPAQCLDRDQAATETAAMDLAEQHRLFIERWSYPCPRALHQGLGELYVNDARFARNLDRVRPGRATYARDAFRANSERRSPQ